MRTATKRQEGKHRTTRQHRAHSGQAVIGACEDAGTTSEAGSTAGGGVNFSVLEKDLRKVSMFELGVRAGFVDRCLGMIDTEEKQLQAIGDLYTIVRAHPKYKNLKEPVWTEKNTPIDVLYWLLRKLGPLASGRAWTVDTYEHKGKTRYKFVYHVNYRPVVTYTSYGREHYGNFMNMYAGEYIVPLDFLPYLLKRDKPLHDMIVDVVALVARYNKVPLWDNDGDFSAGVEKLLDPEDDTINNNEIAYKQRDIYKGGVAAQYLKAIRKRSREVTPDLVNKQAFAYEAGSNRKRDVLSWIVDGIVMARQNGNIADCWHPSYTPAGTIVPFRKYKFVWSLHKHDYVKNYAYNRLNSDKAKYREIIPVLTHELLPTCKEEIVADYHPERLSAFMNEGFKMFFCRYEEYFYGMRLRAEISPSQSLIDRILLSEIQNAGRE